MDLMQVRGFHEIDSESRMPNINEHLKHIRWNNTTEAFEYLTVNDLNITNVTQVDNTITIIRSDATQWQFDLPDTSDLALPGDTKILFDQADAIGGVDNFKYDYSNHRVILSNSKGLYGYVTGDSKSHSILQYLGNRNLFVNFSSDKTAIAGTDNSAMGYEALATVTTGIRNVAIGMLAGSNIATDASGNVLIGSYAGRLETGSNKLYIHNTNYTTLGDFQDNSLLYGEFDNGYLRVNNRLNVSEEVQIGAFDVGNTPAGGMVQFVDAGGGLLKPQYYDNTVWVDFANGINNYVTGGSWTSDILTLTRQGLGDLNISVPDTYYESSGNIYRLQLSGGDNSFIHTDSLTWSVNDVLTVDGAIKLSPHALGDFPVVEGNIINTGTHIYAYIGGTYLQLDNDSTTGEANHGENIGTSVEVYAGLNTATKDLQFYELKGNTKIDISPANEFGNILFDVDYTVSGENLGATGVGIYKTTTHTPTTSILGIKKLYSSDSSVVITAYDDYVNLVATGGAGGEVNDGENVGTGEGRIYDEVNGKNGLLLPYRTLKQGTNITIVTDTGNKYVTIDSDALIVVAANIAGGDANIYKNYTDDGSGGRTLNLRGIKGVDDIEVAVVADVIEVGFDPLIKIPAIGGVTTPVATDANKTLTWSLTYDEDVRNSSPTTESIVQIKLGSNLIYTPATNTLESIGSGDPLEIVANSTIVRNPDGTVDRVSSNRDVVFTKDSGVYVTWDGTTSPTSGLGWLAFENDFPVASDTQQGILQIDESTVLSVVGGVLYAEDTRPASPLTSLQFNDNGSFGGSSGLLYDYTVDTIYFSAQVASDATMYFDADTDKSKLIAKPTEFQIINKGTDTDSLFLDGGRVSIGLTDLYSDVFLQIKDNNVTPKDYIIQVDDANNEIVSRFGDDGRIYFPQLDLNVTSYGVYFNPVNGEITYGPAASGSGGGCNQLVANLGSHTSGTVNLDLDVYTGAIINISGGGTVNIELANAQLGDGGNIEVTHDGATDLTFTCTGFTVKIAGGVYKAASTVQLSLSSTTDVIGYWVTFSNVNISAGYHFH